MSNVMYQAAIKIQKHLSEAEQAGYVLAMRLLQSDLYRELNDEELAAIDLFLSKKSPDSVK
jgi:hypothetical protein